jgi:ParB family transcriptional regulator, chromosome partitioning protein
VGSSGSDPRLARIALERIEADTAQPREDFPRPELEALARSIDSVGLVHPLVVEPAGQGRYRVIAGERRLRALRIGRETGRSHPDFRSPPVLVFPGEIPEATRRLYQLSENLARRNLRPAEVAKGLQAARAALELERLIDQAKQAGLPLEGLPSEPEALRRELRRAVERTGAEVRPVTWAEVLDRVGVRMDPAQRKAYLRLLRLPDDVLGAIDEAGLSAHAASAVARLPDPATQRELVEAATARDAHRAVAQAAAAMEKDPSLVPADAVECVLRAHRAADVERARRLGGTETPMVPADVVDAFARAAKRLIRFIDRETPSPYQAGTIRLLCSEVLDALAQV